MFLCDCCRLTVKEDKSKLKKIIRRIFNFVLICNYKYPYLLKLCGMLMLVLERTIEYFGLPFIYTYELKCCFTIDKLSEMIILDLNLICLF